MLCQKCGRVVRPGNTTGRDEPLTVRRYYCSCGFVNKSVEQVVVTWKKTVYKPRQDPEPFVIPETTAEPVVKRGRRKK